MKIKFFLLGIALTGFSAGVSAQGRFGADSAACVRNIALFMDYYKQKDLKGSYQFWTDAMQTCPPTATQNMYIVGAQLLNYMLEDTTVDAAVRSARIDSLIKLYDERIQYYPTANISDIYLNKGFALNRFRPEDMETAYQSFLKAVERGRERSNPAAFVLAMQHAAELYKAGKLPADDLLETYTFLSKHLDARVNAAPNDEKLANDRRAFYAFFSTSGVASCENLLPLFGKRFEESPEDRELVRTIVQMLSDSECFDSELYVNAVEAYHRLEPSAGSAYALSKLYQGKGDHQTSLKYLRDAIDQQPDAAATNSRYLVEMANIYLSKLNSPGAALSHSRDAVSKDPSNGHAYIMLATVWATSRCGSDDIDQKTKFWVAVDYLERAKQADPSLAEEVNKIIGQYAQYFPTRSEAFMSTLPSDGQSYSVTCNGVTERTTVRTRK